MKVLKFGGTSVGSVESILSLKNIVERETQPVIVVVSALGGITDKLIATSRLALKGDEEYKREFDAIVARHHTMVNTIISDTTERTRLLNVVDGLLEELRSIYYGVCISSATSVLRPVLPLSATASVLAATSLPRW